MFETPRSTEAEQGLIGSLFFNNDLIPDATESITVDHFFNDQNKKIFKAIQFASESGVACDAMTIVDVMKSAGDEPDMAYIAEIIHNTPSARNFKSYLKILTNKQRERAVLYAAHAMEVEICSDEVDSEKKINNALSHITNLDYTASEARTFDSVMINVLNDIEARCSSKGAVGVSTGFCDIDERIGGMNKSDLIILAARPSMGKTTLAMNIAQHTLDLDEGCTLVFSMEMSAEQLMTRMLSSRGKIFLNRLTKGEMEQADFGKLAAATTWVKDNPVVIDDRPSLTPQQVRARALREKRKHGKINLIVVDYLQLMTTNKSENRTNEVSEISRSLKAIAKEMDCPVIALSQLNRSLENRGANDRRPRMSDLRDSGAIEQDADIIWFLYRDEVYNPNTERMGIAELITAKFRNGEIGTDYLASELYYSRFNDFKGEAPSEQESKPQRREAPFEKWQQAK